MININTKNVLNILLIAAIVIIGGCEDELKVCELTPNYSHSETGFIVITNEDVISDTLHTSAYFHQGIEINIATEVTKPGWTFDHWEGDITGTDNPSTLVMDDDKIITAVFTLMEYSLSVTTIGNGSVDESIVLGKTSGYSYGKTVELTATAEAGWRFDHWKGDLTGSDNPSTLIMDSEKSVTAVFVEIPYIINTTIDGEGTINKNPEQDAYLYNDAVEFTALPEEGWTFDHWVGDITGTDNPTIFTVNDTISVTAVFTLMEYSLSVITIGNGSIGESIVLGKTSDYSHGKTVKLTATAEAGWRFDHWKGDLTGSDNPSTLIMDSEKSVTAVFVKIPYSLNISMTGEGTINKNPEKDTYLYNDSVEFTAIPEEGWTFDHWEGDLTGSNNPSTLIMDSEKSVTAVFNENPSVSSFIINFSTIGNGYITRNPKKDSYLLNDTVTLTAVSEEGWTFDHWEGDLTGSNNPSTLIITENINITAVFNAIDYKTENVIIVVMDGVRYSESWGDPNHTNIPYMANYMSDQGVVNTNFYNMEETITTSGHIYMTTGVYQVGEGKSKDYPYYPSIFQYWLEETTNTSNKAWVIASKDKLESLGNCDIGSWEDKNLPKVDCGINGAGTGYRDDSVTYTKTINVLNNYKPNMVLVNLKEPDVSGHSGVWNNYLQSIKVSDQYVYKLWNYINTNSHYKDKTTIFVTNDHGRHLNGVFTGFKDHGCGCDGCRHINFYAYGPDFKQNVILNNKRELIDIPATISELLDFNMPYGKGNVMSELFKY